MSATNVPVPSEPDCSIKVSFRMLTGVSNDRPGNVGNGRPWAVAATTAVTATTPTATGRRRSSVSAAADATSSSGTT